MISDRPPSESSYVRTSGFLTRQTATALGASISVGLGVYLLIGSVFDLIGTQTPTAYLLALLFFLPIVLTLAERFAILPARDGVFRFLPGDVNIGFAFSTSWLLFGGYIFLGATLAWGGAIFLHLALGRYFSLNLPTSVLAATFIGLLLFYQLYGSQPQWARRANIIYGCILFLIILLIWTLVAPPESSGGAFFFTTGTQLEVIPYLAVSLWALSFIIERREQIQQASHWPFLILFLPVLISSLLGALTAYVLLNFPLLLLDNPAPIVSLAAEINPLLEFFAIIVTIILAGFGLHQALNSGVRLAGQLVDKGFLHPEFQRIDPDHQFPLYAYLFIAGIMALLVLVFPPAQLLTATSGALLLTLAFIHLPGLFSTKSPLPSERKFKLPFHPLFPIMTVVLSLSLTALPLFRNQILFFMWVVVGVIYYLAYGRRQGIQSRQKSEMIIDEIDDRKMRHRLLVAIYDKEKADALMSTAVALAQARQAQLYVLQVVVLPEQSTDSHRQQVAHEVWKQLAAYVSIFKDLGNPVPMVRIAPTVASGILSSLWEEKIDTLVIGWPELDLTVVREQDGLVNHIVSKASSEVIIPYRPYPAKIERIIVPMISDVHAPAALATGQALARTSRGTVVAVSYVRGSLTPQRSAAAYDQLQGIIAKLDDKRGVEPLVEPVKNTKNQIMADGQAYDLLLMGVSNEGFLAQTQFGGLPTEVALESETPTILIKAREETVRYWLRRFWENLFNILPTLTAHEQASVYLTMRRDAKANIDFYVLMVLATAIAYFGLLLDSDAVIIGAMLVAPLMAPILALAQGIVQGNATLMRQAAHSTFNGALMAIGLATVATLFLFSIGTPLTTTDAILSRTSPGLLDLLVALVSGAAAAYASSRSNVSGALPGVAIAAALVPPLAVVGYGLGLAQLDIASGALLLFLTNLAAIVLAAAVIFLLLGFRPPQRIERDEQTKFGLRVALVALILVSLPLLITTYTATRQNDRIVIIETILQTNWAPNEARVTDVVVEHKIDEILVSFTVLDFTGNITTVDIAELQQEISEETEVSTTLSAVIAAATLDVIDESFDLDSLTPTVTSTPPASPSAAALPPPAVTPKITGTLAATAAPSLAAETPTP